MNTGILSFTENTHPSRKLPFLPKADHIPDSEKFIEKGLPSKVSIKLLADTPAGTLQALISELPSSAEPIHTDTTYAVSLHSTPLYCCGGAYCK